MRAFQQELPGVPLVAVLETTPYAGLDEAATTYAVPYEWRTEFGIRRYGFHGASHRSASERVQAMLCRNDLRHIYCHLGGSSSLAAFRNGVAIDTSFGTSPQSGLTQNNSVGDIDAFAVLYMMKKLRVGPDEMARILGSAVGPGGDRAGRERRYARSWKTLQRRGATARGWRWMCLCGPFATMPELFCWSLAAWM